MIWGAYFRVVIMWSFSHKIRWVIVIDVIVCCCVLLIFVITIWWICSVILTTHFVYWHFDVKSTIIKLIYTWSFIHQAIISSTQWFNPFIWQHLVSFSTCQLNVIMTIVWLIRVIIWVGRFWPIAALLCCVNLVTCGSSIWYMFDDWLDICLMMW